MTIIPPILTSATPIQVFVVEDESHIQEFLCAAIRADSRLALAGVAATLAEARDWLNDGRRRTDVLLVDLGLPDGSGLELIAGCSALRPEVECMVLSIFGDAENIFAALQAGANGYLLKSSAAVQIVEHILALMAGGSPLSPAVARLVLARTSGQPALQGAPQPLSPTERLSTREIGVLRLITVGYSYTEIASQMFVSPHTVNAHIRNIYRKLQVSSRSEASHVAQRAGLLPKAP